MHKLIISLALLFTLGLSGCRTDQNIYQNTSINNSPITEESNADQSATYHWETEILATDLIVPWDVVILPNSDLLFTERGGLLKKLDSNNKQVTLIANLTQSKEIGEGGLTGITLHPDFSQNNLIYLYYTYSHQGITFNRISQFQLENNSLSNEKFIVDRIPGGQFHNSGRLKFGPDNKLYILTGDATQASLAQEPKSLAGKVLRVNPDGTIPADNPFPNSLVYSLGHRNAQGLDWHPITKDLIITEHGQEAYDEINLIKPGANYGWPHFQQCRSRSSDFTDPIFCSKTSRYAPSGAAFIGDKIDKYKNSFFFATLRGEALRKVDIVDGKAKNDEIILEGYGRIRGVTAVDNRSIIITTSNRDGRGKIQKNDDKIIKLTLKKDN